jgi:iron-sulfur cluster insertion protein
MVFQITDSAEKRIKELLDQQKNDSSLLRISVDGGGCSGFQYKYEFVSNIEKDDFVLSKNEVKVAIDPASQGFMNGCTLDFVESLGSAYFEIKNPNATAKCGCGNSFSV